MTTTTKPQTTFPWLDLLRGVSAIIVVICHLRALTFITFEQAGNVGMAGKIFYFFTSQFGSMAVLVFFVLSGYFITRSIDNLIMRGRWGLDVYFADRLSRLYTVLIPALLLTFLFDSLAYTLFPSAPFFAGDLSHLERNTPSQRMDIMHFLGSLFFLQRVIIEPFGSNGPLWSLSYEFWYYVFFPLILLSIIGSGSKRATYAVCALLLMMFIGYFNVKILVYFLIWLMGSAVHFATKNSQENLKHANIKAVAASIVLILVMIFARLKVVPLTVTDFMIGISTALLTYTLIYSRCPRPVIPISRFLSNISYTLYLVHFPFLAFISSLFGCYNLQFNLSGMTAYFIMLLSTIVFSFIVWWLFEKRTSVVRDSFRRILMKNVPAVSKS